MRWIEIIRLRAARAEGLQSFADELSRSLGAEVGGELRRVRVMVHAAIETDLSVHLMFESESKPDTALGAHVAAALEERGLSERSLWTEVPSPMDEGR